MKKMRHVLLVGLVLLTACSNGDDGKGDVDMIAARAFDPPRLEVAAGETVTFYNGSKESHTVTAYEDSLPAGGGYFASGGASDEDAARDDLSEGLIDPGESFTVTFDEPGTYNYFCIPHESVGMIGTIEVN